MQENPWDFLFQWLSAKVMQAFSQEEGTVRDAELQSHPYFAYTTAQGWLWRNDDEWDN